MRFHHSTRRGRNRLANQSARLGHSQPNSVSSRWAQLSYCRQSNIHFNRRIPVEPPAEMVHALAFASQTTRPPFEGQPSKGALDRRTGGIQMDLATVYDHLSATEDSQIDEQLNGLKINNNKNRDSPTSAKTNGGKPATQARTFKRRSPPTTGVLVESQLRDDQSQTGTMNGTYETAKLDLEGARARLIAKVEKHPLWSTKAAKRMRLTNLEERKVLIYELNSYCERRDLEWRYEPYRGGLAAGSSTSGHRLAHSQPTTPPGSAGEASSFRSGLTTLQVPDPTVQLGGAKLEAPRHFTFERQGSRTERRTGGASAARSQIRRSCSSAAASPIHSAPLPAPQQQQRHSSEAEPLEAMAATAKANQTTTSPCHSFDRPMPSAELVWSIEPPVRLRPPPFTGHAHSSEVPGSSFVKRCHGCQGRGRLKCTSCHGVGYEVCISCSGKGTTRSLAASRSGPAGRGAGSGSGPGEQGGHGASGGDHSAASFGSMWGTSESAARRPEEPGGVTQSAGAASGWQAESCHFCHGAGQKRCWICAGRAYNSCLACAATGQLRCSLSVNITWLNHRDESILNNADSIIPRDRLRLSSGLLLADQIGLQLDPLSLPPGVASQISPPAAAAAGCTSPASQTDQLRLTSLRMLERHARSYRAERLIKQRHKVTQIECFVVQWEWKRRRGHFVIYGDERKVYIAKYPFKSICNIT